MFTVELDNNEMKLVCNALRRAAKRYESEAKFYDKPDRANTAKAMDALMVKFVNLSRGVKA